MQARRIIDTVSHIADDVPVFLYRIDHPLLLHRRKPCEDIPFLNEPGKFLFTELIQFRTGNRLLLIGTLHAH